MQPFSGNQRPDLLTSLMNMSLVLRLPREIYLCRSSSNVPRLPSFFWKTHKTLTFCSLLTRCIIPCACHAKPHLNVQKCSVPLSFLHFWLGNVLPATTTRTFSTSQLPKVVPALCVLCIFTWTCASHHFDLEMCFAPQRRALFRHLNFQVVRTSGALHFDLEMSFTPQRRALFRHLTSKSVPNLVCFCAF